MMLTVDSDVGVRMIQDEIGYERCTQIAFPPIADAAMKDQLRRI